MTSLMALNLNHCKFSSLSDTTVAAIFPNLCLWRGSLCSNLGRIDPEKLYRVTLSCWIRFCPFQLPFWRFIKWQVYLFSVNLYYKRILLKKNSDFLEQLKNKAMRTILTPNHLTCSQTMRDKLGLLTLSSRRRFVRLQLVFKLVNNQHCPT